MMTIVDARAERLQSRMVALMAHAEIMKPEGPGPFATVIQFHGCGGKKPFQSQWAQTIKKAGYAAIVVDSFAHRGISTLEAYMTVCLGARLQGKERAGDVFAALAWARAQEWVARDKIILAGWSHGGWTVLDALALQPGAEAEAITGLSALPDEPLAGVAGAYIVYPYCGLGCLARDRGLRFDAAPLAIVGSDDVVVGNRGLRRTLQNLHAPTPLDVHWFEGATHAFDEATARDLRVRYSPELTARAERLLVDYIDRRTGPNRS